MKVFQIRQDDRFAWCETSKEHMEDMVNKCNWQGRVLELASAATADAVSVTASELSCVINWLEGGRDPKEAAKELRLYCERAWTGAQQGGGELPPLPAEMAGIVATERMREFARQAIACDRASYGQKCRAAGIEEAASVAERCYVKDAFRFEIGVEAAAAIRALNKMGVA